MVRRRIIFASLALVAAVQGRCDSAAADLATEVFQADSHWRPIDYTPMRIVPGSALDFSVFLDAPAGRHGETIRRNGQFVAANEPDHPLRLYGVVLSHGMPFLDKAQCDQLTDYLAASGYNLVRLHLLTAGTPSVMTAAGSTEIKPEKWDQLDYFLASLRRKGLYYMLPLNGWGFFDGSLIHDVPEFKARVLRSDINPLLPISRDASNWLKAYSRALLSHRNPYTGVAMKDDPALLSIELSNEDSLFWELHRNPAMIPVYRRVARERMRRDLGRAPSETEIDNALPAFVSNLQDEFYADMAADLRSEGVNKPLTDATDHNPIGHVLNRSKFDYVDLHAYWALYHALPVPAPGGEPPYQLTLANPNRSSWGVILQNTAPGRIFGSPFMSGEYNSTYPTPYWNFTGPFEAALAAGQAWNAVTRCGLWPYPAVAFHPSPSLRIESGHSPVMMLSERIGALLFAQGDLAPLPAKVPIVLTPDYLRSKLNLRGGPAFPTEYYMSAYRCQLGSVLWTGHEDLSEYPVVVMPEDETLPSGFPRKAVVRTGEPGFAARLDAALAAAGSPAPPGGLAIDSAHGSAKIITPKSEAFLLPSDVASAEGATISIAGNTSTSVVFAGSLDRRPLSESRHVLALYLTETRNTGTVLEHAPKESGIVRHYGTLPLLVRQGQLEFAFRSGNRPLPKVWALRFDGTRTIELVPRRTPDGFTCLLPSLSSPDTFSAFELNWNT